MRTTLYSLFIVCAMLVTACLPDRGSEGDVNVGRMIERTQNQASLYGRAAQQYAVMTQRALLDDALVMNAENGTINFAQGQTLIEVDGRVNMQAFSGLSGSGGLFNHLESAYCDGFLYTWFKSTQPSGLPYKLELKSLGENSIAQIRTVFQRELGASNHAVKGTDGNIHLASGSPLPTMPTMSHCMAAQGIPVGAPMIVTTISAPNIQGGDFYYYEYATEACPGGELGEIKNRQRMFKASDSVSATAVGNAEQWLNTCRSESGLTDMTAAMAANMANVAGFAALSGGMDGDVDCREVTMNEGEANEESFTTCIPSAPSGGAAAVAAKEGKNLALHDTRVEISDPQPCTGGWSGTMTFRRTIEEYRVMRDDGSWTGETIERPLAWENNAISCTRVDTVTGTCPAATYDRFVSGGTITYRRTNVIDDFTITPTNPPYEFVSNTCVYTHTAGSRYLFEDQALPNTVPHGTANVNASHYVQLRNLCTNASTAPYEGSTEDRWFPCAAHFETGIIHQRRAFDCTGAGTGTWAGWGTVSNTCCDADVFQTRTTTPCPGGTADGIVTERRDQVCPAITWTAWYVTSNTCIPIVHGACGASHGAMHNATPATNLCNAGTPTAVSAVVGSPYSWQCQGVTSAGSTANCSATRRCALPWGGWLNHGANVTAYSAASATMPTTCASISQTRSCNNGALSGTFANQACTQMTNGACGASHGGHFTSAPAANLCSAGTATAVGGSGPYTWSCNGINGGTNASCSANRQCGLPWGGWTNTGTSVTAYSSNIATTPTTCASISQSRTCTQGSLSGSFTNQSCTQRTNGACGASNGGHFTSAPAANLCTAGNATAVGGSGPYTWSCNGINGGTNASCSANRQCTRPWGGTMNTGTSITAYSTNSVVSPATCASVAQTRTCTQGSLSGSFTHQSCSVSAPACQPNGHWFDSGIPWTYEPNIMSTDYCCSAMALCEGGTWCQCMAEPPPPTPSNYWRCTGFPNCMNGSPAGTCGSFTYIPGFDWELVAGCGGGGGGGGGGPPMHEW